MRDLFQAQYGVRLDTFPAGRDGGVDVRLHQGGRELFVVQCKHTPGKKFSQIRAQLLGEAKKIGSRFSGQRYFLATSASLTRANKQEIAVMFSRAKLSEGDILGLDDIENLLVLHPRVEIANFKLWITSTAVLDRLLSSDLYTRNAALVDRIVARRRLYVHSEAFPQALDMLNASHVCVISGEPGIGKTTLAQTLLLQLLADGWSLHVASEDVSDIERAWKPDVRQAFFYDDFLGQNSVLESLSKNEDSRLAQVIAQVEKSADKRLIMTTREYILRQATQVYEPLSRIDALDDVTDGARVLLNLGHYTREQRAQIFYNHIHFSDLPASARRAVVLGGSYRAIVGHPNFNPRLIELITSNFGRSKAPGADFPDYAAKSLDNPQGLWGRIFENQLTGTERLVLLLLATARSHIELSDLLAAVRRYEEALHGRTSTDANALYRSLKKLQGTFVALDSQNRLYDPRSGIHPQKKSTLISLKNPSFADYICEYLASRPTEIAQIASGCAFFEQAETLVHWELAGEPLLESLAAAGPRFQRARRLSPGQQHSLMDALLRLEKAESCQWEARSSWAWVRRRPVPASRHLFILLLDQKYGRSLAGESTVRLITEALRQRFSEGQQLQGLDLELLRLLSAYDGLRPVTTCIRDDALESSMMSLEHPRDFVEALSLIVEIDIPQSERSRQVEAVLRSTYADFARAWDREQASVTNGITECEDALEALRSASSMFGVEFSHETSELGSRLELLREEAFEYYDPSDNEERDYGDWAQRPRRNTDIRPEIRSPAVDEVDSLFATLIE